MVHPQKSQALAEIRAHLQANGPRDWDSLRHRMNFIGPATFWRYVSQVKAQIPPELIATSTRQRVGDHASTSHRAGRRFDFLGAYHGLWADATRLRSHALHSDGNVRNPAILDRAIRIRLKLLRQGLELEARIFSAAAQRAFYDGLVAEIAAESPALHKRLVSRLRGFSSQFDREQSKLGRRE
jgi:hypothetical protein